MPTHKPKGTSSMGKIAYTAMRSFQKKGQLKEFDVTAFPRAFSYIKGEDTPSEEIYLGYELETYILNEGTQTGFSATASKISKTKYGALCNFRAEYYASFEMVSIPATLNFHRKSIDELLDMTGFTSRNNNGMHVHISKSNFKDKIHLSKFMLFVNAAPNREFMEYIAGRAMNSFCAPNTNLGIRYKDKSPSKIDLKFDGERNPLTLVQEHGTGKHCAINTAPRATVELRIFLAPVNKHKLISNLEFTEALVKFCKEAEMKDLSVDSFVNYVSMFSKKYKYLHRDVGAYLPKPAVKKQPAVKQRQVRLTTASVASVLEQPFIMNIGTSRYNIY